MTFREVRALAQAAAQAEEMPRRYYAVVDDEHNELAASLDDAKARAVQSGTFCAFEVEVAPGRWPDYPESSRIVANYCQTTDGSWFREEVTED